MLKSAKKCQRSQDRSRVPEDAKEEAPGKSMTGLGTKNAQIRLQEFQESAIAER